MAPPSFHAPFLDGLRGAAALGVVYQHSQTLFNQPLGFTTYNQLGYDGVRMFFVSS